MILLSQLLFLTILGTCLTPFMTMGSHSGQSQGKQEFTILNHLVCTWIQCSTQLPTWPTGWLTLLVSGMVLWFAIHSVWTQQSLVNGKPLGMTTLLLLLSWLFKRVFWQVYRQSSQSATLSGVLHSNQPTN